MSDILVLQALVIVCGTTALVASLRVLRRYLELKHERRVPGGMDALSERLERIELTVDATAVEVERISEANRFMAKLLADRNGPPTPATRPERAVTPH
jgi:hypothetical protein